MGVSNYREYEETQVKQHRAAVQEKFEMQRQIGRLEATLGRETHHVSDVEAQVGGLMLWASCTRQHSTDSEPHEAGLQPTATLLRCRMWVVAALFCVCSEGKP